MNNQPSALFASGSAYCLKRRTERTHSGVLARKAVIIMFVKVERISIEVPAFTITPIKMHSRKAGRRDGGRGSTYLFEDCQNRLNLRGGVVRTTCFIQ